MACVKLLVGGLDVWVDEGTVVRLCPPESDGATMTVGVGRVKFVCDRGIFEGDDECVLSAAARFHADLDTLERHQIPDAEAELFPVLLDYLRRRSSRPGVDVQLQTFNMTPAQSKALDELVAGLLPGLERERFPVEGDEAIVVLNGSYGTELPVSASADPVVASLVRALESLDDPSDPKARAAYGELAIYLRTTHEYPWLERGPYMSSRVYECPLYLARVPRGSLFEFTEYDGSQRVRVHDPDSYFCA